MNTKKIIHGYFECWVKNDRDGARKLLDDKLKFRSPVDNFDNADDFLNKCWIFADELNELNVYQEIYDDISGYIVYGINDFVSGEYIKVGFNKITEIYVTFNPTVDRKDN